MRRLRGYGPLRQEPVKPLLKLLLTCPILGALQEKPSNNLIGIAVGVILPQAIKNLSPRCCTSFMQRRRDGSVRPSLPPSYVARASPVKAGAKWKRIRRKRPSSQPGEEETYVSPSGQLEFSGSGRQSQQMADSLFSLIARLVSLKGHLPLP